MGVLLWVIVAVIAFAVVYVWALGFKNRKEAPDTKEHGVDLQARRKLYDDIA